MVYRREVRTFFNILQPGAKNRWTWTSWCDVGHSTIVGAPVIGREQARIWERDLFPSVRKARRVCLSYRGTARYD